MKAGGGGGSPRPGPLAVLGLRQQRAHATHLKHKTRTQPLPSRLPSLEDPEISCACAHLMREGVCGVLLPLGTGSIKM